MSGAAQDLPRNDKTLAGGGELGALMRGRDWQTIGLGPPESWPRSLKTAVRIMLTSRQPIWIGWGPDLIFLYNDPYKSIIGGKHPWALGRPTSEVWHEIWPEIGPMLVQAMGGTEGTYVESQRLIMERNGYPEETYYTFSYSPIPDDLGDPCGIICANTDTTRQVIGERQLALLRDLGGRTLAVRNLPEVIAQAAAALDGNRQDLVFSLILLGGPDGRELQTVGGTGFAGALPDAASLSAWALEEILERRQARVLPIGFADDWQLAPGPWTYPVRQAAVLPIRPAGDGGRTGLLVAGLNPLRLFDADYQGFLDLAAGQIAAAIANAEAYEQESRRAAMLAELDQAKTVFFSNVSHEFRTPLTLMLGPLEDMLAEADGSVSPERDRLALVHRNALRLLKLVNSLLDFSRIEAGRAQARFMRIDLAAFTAELASNFRSAMERAGLAFHVDCPPLSLPVYVDGDMWEKIVLNLLSNAFKFTFRGSIAVTLREDGDAVLLSVSDSGIGIAADQLPHIFERFRRAEGGAGRSIEGSGIGLALVQELVRLHGGRIEVESAPGQGTRFLVRLPSGSSHLPPAHIVQEELLRPGHGLAQAFVEEAMRWLPENSRTDVLGDLSAGAEARRVRPSATILVADDNADMRDYIRRLLGQYHQCSAVIDGQAALEAIRTYRPDLLLTDVMMPRLDGFGLVAAIRADPDLADLPVIMLSARAGVEASAEGLRAGADDYLVKPFSARELIARVDGVLALARTRRALGDALREEAQSLEILNRVGITVAAELDLNRVVQLVADAATELTGAACGAFFYAAGPDGAASGPPVLAGVRHVCWQEFAQDGRLPPFAPSFAGKGVLRSGDASLDPRYCTNPLATGGLAIRSYLAVPVVSRSRELLGGLFLGHPDADVFTERDERLVSGIAAQTAIAIDNAKLYQAAQTEIAERIRTEAALRQSEERLAGLNQQLESRVAERTAELAAANERLRTEAVERLQMEQVLRHAQKMEAVGKLTGGVAHDFNNLLQIVGGNLQLLAKDVAGSESAEKRIRNALAGVARGSKLASQLLAFGRRQPLAPKVINLGRLVRGLDDLLRRALGDGIEIETVISAGLWNSLVDPAQVENALLNLAINARDAMDGHGRLTIEAGNALLDDDYAARHGDLVPGQYVMLAVSDTGRGMGAEIIEHVFEPFFTTKPEGQGTGLGLSMVYGFVKQSGGHVKIYSEPEQGTTVRLYLPRMREAEDLSTEAEAGPVAGGRETILVAEDDDEVRATVVDMLVSLGYSVLKANNGESALAIIESNIPIDLLFTDVVMPGSLRSPDLARKAREIRPGLAVLFTSGYTDNAIVHGGRLDEGVDLLSKPYTREALARKVRQVLRQGERWEGTERQVPPVPGAMMP